MANAFRRMTELPTAIQGEVAANLHLLKKKNHEAVPISFLSSFHKCIPLQRTFIQKVKLVKFNTLSVKKQTWLRTAAYLNLGGLFTGGKILLSTYGAPKRFSTQIAALNPSCNSTAVEMAR